MSQSYQLVRAAKQYIEVCFDVHLAVSRFDNNFPMATCNSSPRYSVVQSIVPRDVVDVA